MAFMSYNILCPNNYIQEITSFTWPCVSGYLVPCKSDFPVYACTVAMHRKSYFLQDTRNKIRPCLSGHCPGCTLGCDVFWVRRV